MISQHSLWITPHSSHVWHPLPCTWHRIHSITPNHSIYDVIATWGMTSHPLFQTLYPLYLCHHNFSTDITPTFEWHHTHLLCDIICTIYNLTSNPDVIALLYLGHHNLYIWNHIQYVGQHIHYTWDITATICVLTDSEDIIVWCIENITPTLCMTLLLPYVWHPLHYTKHHILTLWPQTTMFMSSHPLYWTSCPLYLCHHIHSIDDITPTEFLRSNPLYMTI